MQDTLRKAINLSKSKINPEFAEIRSVDYQSNEIVFIQGKKTWIQGENISEILLSVWTDGVQGQSSTTINSEAALEDLINNAAESANLLKESKSFKSQYQVLNKQTSQRKLINNLDEQISTRDKLNFIRNFTPQNSERPIITTVHYSDRSGLWNYFDSNEYYITHPVEDFKIQITNEVTYAKKRIVRTSYYCGRLNKLNFDPKTAKEFIEKRKSRLLNTLIVNNPPKERMNVLFDGSSVGRIIHELMHGIEGDVALTTSPWKKIEKKVFSGLLTIYDVPVMKKFPLLPQTYYDAEGYQTEKSLIIEKGKIITFITDSKTSRLLECSNTHNARFSSFTNPSFPACTNLVVESGDHNLEQLITEVDIGIYCQGINFINIDWDNNKIQIVPEQSRIISQGKVSKDLYLNVDINYPIDDFMKRLKLIGKNVVPTTIFCTKGGGLISGSIAPPMFFERLKVLN